MRQIICILFSSIIIAFSAFAQAPYQIKSAKIEFVSYPGYGVRSTKTLIFTDSGKIQKIIYNMYADTSANNLLPDSLPKTKDNFSIMSILVNDTIYTFDLNFMTGTKNSKNDVPNLPMDKVVITSDTFFNRICEVHEIYGLKAWYWKGIALKSGFSKDNGIFEYATSIDENYIIKEDEFNFPENIEMKDKIDFIP